jgi:hypothetical protein
MKRFMAQFRQLVQADRSALKIQVLYRARLIKFLYKNIKAAGVLDKAKKAYAKEMAELHDGTKVRAVVQRDRKKEKREYQIFLMEEEKARRLEALYWVVEWPWVEMWDETNECYTYWHEKLAVSKYEKPTYTIDQENSVFVLQKWCRHLIEMRLMKEWTRRTALEEKEHSLQVVWSDQREARERYVTITIHINAAEPDFMRLHCPERPIVQLTQAKHPRAKTLLQLEQQYERLQEYADTIDEYRAGQQAAPLLLKDMARGATMPDAARAMHQLDKRIVQVGKRLEEKQLIQRKLDRAKTRNTRRPKSRERSSSTDGNNDGNNDGNDDGSNNDEGGTAPRPLEPYFARRPCMLNASCRLKHGHSGPHACAVVGQAVVTRFGPGVLQECRNIYDARTQRGPVPALENNLLVCQAVLLFWDTSVKKQRAPFLPEMPGPGGSVEYNAQEIKAALSTVTTLAWKQLLQGVRTFRANMNTKKDQKPKVVAPLGHCPESQCMRIIGSEMKKMTQIEKKKARSKWINKNKLMALTISRKMNDQARKKKEREAEEEEEEEAGTQEGGTIEKKKSSKASKTSKSSKTSKKSTKTKNNTKGKDSNRDMSGSTSMRVASKKLGLFGTGSGKYCDRMCKVQLDVVGGVYPVDRPEKYVHVTVPKSDIKWYPPIPLQQVQIETEIKYTHVDMPLGWIEVTNHDGSVFFAYEPTGETQWDRPSYTVKQDLNAVSIQKYMRGWYGRILFQRKLRNTSMLDIVRDTVQQGSFMGWVGYGFEGMDCELFFHRMAMPECAKYVQKYRKDRGGKKIKIKGSKGRVQLRDLIHMDDDALKTTVGITNKVYRKRIVAMSQRIVVEQAFWNQTSMYLQPRFAFNQEFQLHGSRKRLPKRQHYSGLLKNLPALKPGQVLEQGEIIDLGEEFGYIADRHHIQALFLHKHKSHDKRAEEIPDVVEQSTTPITYLMMQAHLTKHGGRAKAAADLATELCGRRTFSTPEQVLQICRLYLRTADRLTMILKKLQMPTLRWKMVSALRLVAPMMKRLELAEQQRLLGVEEDKQRKIEELAAIAQGKRLKDGGGKKKSRKNSLSKIERNHSQGPVKTGTRKDKDDGNDNGNTNNEDPTNDTTNDDDSNTTVSVVARPTSSELRMAAAAQRPPGKQFHLPPGPMLCQGEAFPLGAAVAQIVRDAMQWVFRFDRASSIVQFNFRCFVLKRDGRAHRRKVHALLTKVQAMWRGVLARRFGLALKWQFASAWEQLFDESQHMYYFYNNHTKSSQWNAPYVPFRPFGWWPEPEPPRKAPKGHCTRCFLEKATRGCHQCVDKDNGYRMEYCFACFAIAHRESVALQSHTFDIINNINNQYLTCVECQSQATRKCLDCDDAYCKAHFNALHRRGNRSKHMSYGFALGAPVCVECENDIALKFCTQCGDQFCLTCYSHVHRKGKKKLHTYDTMPSLEDGLDVLQSFIEKEKAVKLNNGEGDGPSVKGPPSAAPPPVRKAFEMRKKGKKGESKKPVKPPKNSRKDMAMAAHSVDSNVAVRRNRPKNWRKLRPDKPRPVKKIVKVAEEVKKE